MTELKTDPWHNREPLYVEQVLTAMSLSFKGCNPLAAAAGALFSIEAIPRFRESLPGKNMPDETPMHQGYESAKAYLLTLFRIQDRAENGSLADLLTNEPTDESSAATIGKIQACEDVLIILEKIQTPEISFSQN